MQSETNKVFHVHFICTGNIYRSRLAEAYLNSKKIPNLRVSSSGTKANIQHKGPISWYGLRLLIRNNLIPYMKNSWTQATAEEFKNVDLVIFMSQDNYLYCQKLKYAENIPFEIWDLPDFDDSHLNTQSFDQTAEIKLIEESEALYLLVKQKVNALITKLRLQ